MIDGPDPDEMEDGEEESLGDDPEAEGSAEPTAVSPPEGQPIKAAVRTGVMQRPPRPD